jgi:hypothetical protein
MFFEFHNAFAFSQQKIEAYRREAEIARSIRAARVRTGFRSHVARIFRQMADRIDPKTPALVR